MRFNYSTQSLEDGAPSQVYSRSNGYFISLDNETQTSINFLSSLSQVMYNLELEVFNLDKELFSNAIRTINTALNKAQNGNYVLDDAFGNVFNYVMYHADDMDKFMLDTVAKNFTLTAGVSKLYTRSTGQRVYIEDMQDDHLYRAFRRRMIDKFNFSEDYFKLIDTLPGPMYKFLQISIVTASSLIDMDQFDSEMKGLLEEIVSRAEYLAENFDA